jgi:VWFA-related protein
VSLKLKTFGSAVAYAASLAGLAAQAPSGSSPARAAASQQPTPTFTVNVNAVSTDVIVRDAQGRFVADLTKDEFEVFEDGVRQEIVSMTKSLGGRVTDVLQPPPAAPPEGVLLPPRRADADATPGRVFVFFVDDLHLQVLATSRVRALFKQFAKELMHEGDLFGIVSSGPSSIAVDMTLDTGRLDEAIERIIGHALRPSDIIDTSAGVHGPSELRHRVQVAFRTMYDVLRGLEQVKNRRKALVWVSEGYDFNPFQEARLGLGNPNGFFQQNQGNFIRSNRVNEDGTRQPVINPMVEAQRQNEQFSDADLASALGELTRAANRANATIYTIDPRGLAAGTDVQEQVNPTEWADYLRKSQDTLRVLAEETGGLAVINENDFNRALRRIDADTSDYYVIGYSSANPDVSRRRRRIEVRVTRPGLNVWSRTEYVAP